jgi:hypothetical protein
MHFHLHSPDVLLFSIIERGLYAAFCAKEPDFRVLATRQIKQPQAQMNLVLRFWFWVEFLDTD